MALSRSTLSHASLPGILLLLITLLSLINLAYAADTKVIQTTNNAGEVIYLADDRKPALYTQNFGDCLGNSLINVTRFDAAYYKDNMTVLFHLEGSTALTNESLMSMCTSTLMSYRSNIRLQCTLASLPMVHLDSTSTLTRAMLKSTGR